MSEELYIYEEGFHVTNDETAEWCIRKIKKAQADQARWKAHYEAQMEKVNRATESAVAYFSGLLEEYFASVPHHTTKTSESYALPGGKLIRKHRQPKFTLDEDVLVPWLKENEPSLVKVKETADWANLKRKIGGNIQGATLVTEYGEIVPGVSVEEQPDEFRVEVSE